MEDLAQNDALFVESEATELTELDEATRATLFSNSWSTSQDGFILADNTQNDVQAAVNQLVSTDVSSNEVYTEYKERTLKMQLSTITAPWESPTQADATELITIANECPLTAGNGVFKARAQLAILLRMDVDYLENCGTKNEALKKSEDSDSIGLFGKTRLSETKNFRVYPNPAKDQFFVELPKLKSRAYLQVFDSYGRLITRYELQGNHQELLVIDTRGYSKGLYYLQFLNQTMQTSKKIIIH